MIIFTLAGAIDAVSGSEMWVPGCAMILWVCWRYGQHFFLLFCLRKVMVFVQKEWEKRDIWLGVVKWPNDANLLCVLIILLGWWNTMPPGKVHSLKKIDNILCRSSHPINISYRKRFSIELYMGLNKPICCGGILIFIYTHIFFS